MTESPVEARPLLEEWLALLLLFVKSRSSGPGHLALALARIHVTFFAAGGRVPCGAVLREFAFHRGGSGSLYNPSDVSESGTHCAARSS